MGLIGVMIGSLFGGPLITKGRRFAVMWFSVLLMFGVILTMFRTMPTMCLGRFVSGFSGGIL